DRRSRERSFGLSSRRSSPGRRVTSAGWTRSARSSGTRSPAHFRKEEAMVGANNPLNVLTELGQSVWYDYIRRDLVRGGGLARLIAEDGLRGMTSNPTIFQKAIAETDLYDEQIRQLGRSQSSTFQIFEGLAVSDVRDAADVFRPVYEETGGEDGFVSIEVRPHLARDTQG